MEIEREEWDRGLKYAFTRFFMPLMQFCYPEIAAQIDWEYPPEFLDRALHNS